jgi:hypothetical protein
MTGADTASSVVRRIFLQNLLYSDFLDDSLDGYLLRHGLSVFSSSILYHNFVYRRVVVYSPQIYENYKLKSGEGVSVPFVAIWLLGDLLNLVGAALAGLLPTVIVLAIWVRLTSSRITNLTILSSCPSFN